MPNQKMENLLNLALEVPQEERLRSNELETGYDPESRSWELIVKYSGSLDAVREMGIQTDEMRNEYAVLTVPENLIDAVSRLPQIEYIEKPKRLFFAINQAKAASCVNLLQEDADGAFGLGSADGLSGGGAETGSADEASRTGSADGLSGGGAETGSADEASGTGSVIGLSGRGVLVAVLDSGIDYYHEDFRNEDGTTRILLLWDQVLGRVFTEEEINEALRRGSRSDARQVVPSVDASGHGTSVAGIAAGNGREGNGRYRGIAYESPLLVVKLGNARPDGFPRTTELMRAVNFAVEQAVARNMPLVINISFGNTYGSHDGTSLLETFMNDISNYGKTTIVVGSGNEGAAAGHTSGQLVMGRDAVAELSVSPYETGLSLQLWKAYTDRFEIRLRTPSGELLGPLSEELGPARYRYGNTHILTYYGKPGPYSTAQEIYFDLIPAEGSYIDSGLWAAVLTPIQIVEGVYDFWLPSAAVINSSTRFLSPTPDTTLTIPSAAANVITVGAYDSVRQIYADFSGRGYTRLTRQVKPDLAAPGVGLMVSAAGGGYQAVTGTSFAAPMVSGSAALLMQWGIMNGNDPFLYGEKVKAYLRRGAKPLPGFGRYPNEEIGYGALCVRDSLPV